MSGSWARVTSLLIGLWLIASPFLLESSTSQMNNTWLAGAVAAVVALLSLARPQVRFINAAVGVWVFLSAFMFPGTGEMMWNNAACGLLLLALSLARERGRHPGPFSHHHKIPV